jgi:hypothetical protein
MRACQPPGSVGTWEASLATPPHKHHEHPSIEFNGAVKRNTT